MDRDICAERVRARGEGGTPAVGDSCVHLHVYQKPSHNTNFMSYRRLYLDKLRRFMHVMYVHGQTQTTAGLEQRQGNILCVSALGR